MQYGTEFSRELINLRRYARAISGSQEVGDDLVVATLEAMTHSPPGTDDLSTRAKIFQLLSRLWNTPAWAARCRQAPSLAGVSYNAAAADQRLVGILVADLGDAVAIAGNRTLTAITAGQQAAQAGLQHLVLTLVVHVLTHVDFIIFTGTGQCRKTHTNG